MSADSNQKIPRIGIFPRYNLEFTQLELGIGYIDGVLRAGGMPSVLPSTTDSELWKTILESFDGFVIPGGPDINPAYYGEEAHPMLGPACPIRDEMEYALVKEIIEADKPLLGICRGAQVINVVLGGTLYQDIPSFFEPCHEHHPEGPRNTLAHTVSIEEDTKLARIMGTTTPVTNSIHHQCVKDLAEGLIITAHSSDGVIEGIEYPEKRFVVGVQWHPEELIYTEETHMNLFHALIAAAREQIK